MNPTQFVFFPLLVGSAAAGAGEGEAAPPSERRRRTHLEPMLVSNPDTGLPKTVKLRCSLCDHASLLRVAPAADSIHDEGFWNDLGVVLSLDVEDMEAERPLVGLPRGHEQGVPLAGHLHQLTGQQPSGRGRTPVEKKRCRNVYQ